MDLSTRLDELAALHPDIPALIFSAKRNHWETISYRQLAESSSRLFRGLCACSLTPGMRAALMIPPSVDFFALAFALLKAGIVPVIVDPAIGVKKLGECLAESKPEIFFGNSLTHLLRFMFGWGKHTIKHNLTIEKVKALQIQAAIPFLSPNSPAAIIYTSGSTGLPKGAIYTRGNFIAQLEMLRNTFQIAPDEVDLPAFPLYALIDVLLGVTSIIPDISFPVPAQTNPDKVIQAIQRFNVTNMFASPVVLDILAEYGIPHNIRLPSLKRVITAGAPATISLQQRFRQLLDGQTDLFGIYGATETLPIAKIESREVFSLKEKTENGAGVCLGKPIDGVTVRVVEITDGSIQIWQDSLQVGTNVVGEITVQSPATTRSYIQREEANRASKIKLGDEIIHRTGDVGYVDEQGRLWYCGRKSHRVVTKDGVLFTEQVENIFNNHPDVYRTALVGVRSEPVLWVERIPKVKTKEDTIKSELIELASHHSRTSQIKTILFAEKFPTDVRHNSKVIREQLARRAEEKLK